MADERAVAMTQQPNNAIVTESWNREQLELLKRTVAQGLSDDEFALFVHVARHRRLDPFARQIYGIKRSGRLTIQTSIDGFRLIAQRSGEYAGQDGPYWCGTDGVWRDVWFDTNPPAAAKVGVLRKGFQNYVYAVARWANYASVNRQNVWLTMPDLMLAKAAEALALRRAFPEELSGLYTSDEMDQADEYDAPPPSRTSGPRASTPPQQQQQAVNYDGMRGKPQTERQRARLHAIANERGWQPDQLHGRAGEINPAARETLDALDRAEISELMDAVENEAPWVDPRQQRLIVDTDGVIVDAPGPDDDPLPSAADSPAHDLATVNMYRRKIEAADSIDQLREIGAEVADLYGSESPEMLREAYAKRQRTLKRGAAVTA